MSGTDQKEKGEARIVTKRFLYLISVVLIYFLVGFYPYSWKSPIILHANAMEYVQGSHLSVHEPGIAYTKSVPDWLRPAIESSDLTVTLKVRTASHQQTGPARILTISKDPFERNVMLGQEGADLVLRLRRPGANKNGVPAYTIDNVFSSSDWQRIVLTMKGNRLTLSINGNEKISESLSTDIFTKWSFDFSLAFANELTYDRPWIGDIDEARISVAGTTTDYLISSERLYVPQSFITVKRIRDLRLVLFGKNYEFEVNGDFWVNLLGFIPLGMLFVFLYKSRHAVIKAALFCTLVSLSIELTQLFLSDRYTSIIDLILNMLGGTAGALIGMLIMKRRSISTYRKIGT